MKKSIAIGALFFVLFALMTPVEVFAQKKQKLGEAEAKKLLEKVGNANSTEVRDAINIIQRYAKDFKSGTGVTLPFPKGMAPNVKSKKLKEIFSLVDGGVGILEKINTIAEAADLAWNYKYYADSRDKSVKKAANLMFDTLDFASGLFVGGNYYKAGITAGRTLLKLYLGHLGEIRWNEIYDGAYRFHAPNSAMLWDYPNQPRAYWQDREYYEFAKAWFCAAYDPKNDDGDDALILMHCGEYIWAMKTLRKAGLL